MVTERGLKKGLSLWGSSIFPYHLHDSKLSFKMTTLTYPQLDVRHQCSLIY